MIFAVKGMREERLEWLSECVKISVSKSEKAYNWLSFSEVDQHFFEHKRLNP